MIESLLIPTIVDNTSNRAAYESPSKDQSR